MHIGRRSVVPFCRLQCYLMQSYEGERLRSPIENRFPSCQAGCWQLPAGSQAAAAALLVHRDGCSFSVI